MAVSGGDLYRPLPFFGCANKNKKERCHPVLSLGYRASQIGELPREREAGQAWAGLVMADGPVWLSRGGTRQFLAEAPPKSSSCPKRTRLAWPNSVIASESSFVALGCSVDRRIREGWLLLSSPTSQATAVEQGPPHKAPVARQSSRMAVDLAHRPAASPTHKVYIRDISAT